jgi:hypothetical protein
MAHNVEHRIEGEKLIITVSISKASITAAPPSSTGKTCMVASTGGYTTITAPHVKGTKLAFSVNVTAKD